MTAELNLATATRIPVPFAGARTRTGPLTLGQANMRACVLRDEPDHINMRVIWPLPAGTSVTRVADALRALLLRHESLRTTYPQDPEPRQHVAGAGLLEVVRYDCDGRLEPAALAKRVQREMRAVRFDPSAELPLRVALICDGADPTHIIIVLSHMAVDATALGAISSEWHELIIGRQLGPPCSVQPLDVAEREHTPAGQRRAMSSLRYWQRLLGRAPQAAFAVSGAGETDWMVKPLRIRSQQAARALGLIEARTGAGRGTIVLAAMCALVAHRIAHRSFKVALMSANRYLPELTDYIGSIAQDALMSVELEDTTFDAVIRHVRARSFVAYRYSWFDYNALSQIITDTGRSRGTGFTRDCVFNDLSTFTLDGFQFGPGRSPNRQDAATELELTWLRPEPMPTRLMLWALRLDEEADLCLWADSQVFAEDETQRFARAIIGVLLAAAERDIDLGEIAEISGISPVTRGAGWYLLDSCWIELAAVRRLVGDVLGERPFHVEPVADRLVCYVAAEPGEAITPEWVHDGCVALLNSFRPTAMAPHHYVVCAASGDGDDAEAWRLRRVITEGSGRDDSAGPGAS